MRAACPLPCRRLRTLHRLASHPSPLTASSTSQLWGLHISNAPGPIIAYWWRSRLITCLSHTYIPVACTSLLEPWRAKPDSPRAHSSPPHQKHPKFPTIALMADTAPAVRTLIAVLEDCTLTSSRRRST